MRKFEYQYVLCTVLIKLCKAIYWVGMFSLNRTKTVINGFMMDTCENKIRISNSDDVNIKNSVLRVYLDPITLTNDTCYIDSSIIESDFADCISNDGTLAIGTPEESTPENMIIQSKYKAAINNKSGNLNIERGLYIGDETAIYDESENNISIGTLNRNDYVEDAKVIIAAGATINQVIFMEYINQMEEM